MAILDSPRFSSGSVHGNNATMAAYFEILHADGADLLLSGDDHVYERFAPQDPQGYYDPTAGVREIIAGTGGGSLYSFGTIRRNSEVRKSGSYGILEAHAPFRELRVGVRPDARGASAIPDHSLPLRHQRERATLASASDDESDARAEAAPRPRPGRMPQYAADAPRTRVANPSCRATRPADPLAGDRELQPDHPRDEAIRNREPRPFAGAGAPGPETEVLGGAVDVERVGVEVVVLGVGDGAARVRPWPKFPIGAFQTQESWTLLPMGVSEPSG